MDQRPPLSGPRSFRLRMPHDPDFLSRLVALGRFMWLSLRKAAHAAMSSAAWQEIRVSSHSEPGELLCASLHSQYSFATFTHEKERRSAR
jgi:hypothetical protein